MVSLAVELSLSNFVSTMALQTPQGEHIVNADYGLQRGKYRLRMTSECPRMAIPPHVWM